MTRRGLKTPFFEQLEARLRELGGMHNAHLHLDRAGTLDDRYLARSERDVAESSHVSLHAKHALIGAIHCGPAYEREDLRRRVHEHLDAMVEVGTVRADTLVDVTPDAVGTRALEALLEIKEERRSEIELRIGAYTPLGFNDAEPARWEIFERGARMADFIGSLPEADDVVDYPDNIGFGEHCRRVLLLAQELGRPVHVHTDQRHEPTESGTEQLLDAIREHGAPSSANGEPMVWAVHMVSPSTYEEQRFRRLVDGLLECGVGVICCPSAAIGMRQLRPLRTPTSNSIPRVLELLEAGVHVRLASDNIADICSPSTTPDLVDEVFVLSAALRFYHVNVLATLAAGLPLDEAGREVVREHLARDRAEVDRVVAAARAREAGTDPDPR